MHVRHSFFNILRNSMRPALSLSDQGTGMDSFIHAKRSYVQVRKNCMDECFTY